MEIMVIKLTTSLEHAKTVEEIIECGKGNWRADPTRVFSCKRVAFISPDRKVLAIALINGIMKEEGGRISLVAAFDEAGNDWLGKTMDANNSRNPISYVDERDFENKLS